MAWNRFTATLTNLIQCRHFYKEAVAGYRSDFDSSFIKITRNQNFSPAETAKNKQLLVRLRR
jgi:hypothetical protein